MSKDYFKGRTLVLPTKHKKEKVMALAGMAHTGIDLGVSSEGSYRCVGISSFFDSLVTGSEYPSYTTGAIIPPPAWCNS